MREEYTTKTKDSVIVSVDLVNQIAQELIAQAETEEELENLVLSYTQEQELRKKAWKKAYQEYPIQSGYVPIDTRREIQLKRDELAEKYYQQLKNQLV